MIYRTRWPLFDFWLRIWKLQIVVELFTTPIERLTREYVALVFNWGNERLFVFRLYDSLQEKPTFSELLKKDTNSYTLEDLKKIKDQAESLIKERNEKR